MLDPKKQKQLHLLIDGRLCSARSLGVWKKRCSCFFFFLLFHKSFCRSSSFFCYFDTQYAFYFVSCLYASSKRKKNFIKSGEKTNKTNLKSQGGIRNAPTCPLSEFYFWVRYRVKSKERGWNVIRGLLLFVQYTRRLYLFLIVLYFPIQHVLTKKSFLRSKLSKFMINFSCLALKFLVLHNW